MCNNDYDSPEFYVNKSHRATRDHNCSECGRIICKGESYERIVGKWFAVIETFKTCAHCVVVQEWIIKQCGNNLHGGLREEIGEHASYYQKIFIYKYLIGMKRKWKRIKDHKLMSLPKCEEGIIE